MTKLDRPAGWLPVAGGLGVGLAVLAAVLVLAAGPAYRTGSLGLRTAFSLLRWGAYAGAAAAVVSLVVLALSFAWPSTARRVRVLAALGLLFGAALFAYPASQLSAARQVPPIHDITTDLEDPPAFVAVLPLRAGAPNPVAYGGPSVAAQQRRAYPDLVPLTLREPPPEAFARALAAARTMGWELVAADPGAGRIEATDTTFWFGFKDDVVIRIRPDDGGSRVDVRSLSRVGGGDAGANAKRIRAYLRELAG